MPAFLHEPFSVENIRSPAGLASVYPTPKQQRRQPWSRDMPRTSKKAPKGNANFAWVQHFIHHLAPDGHAGFVLANGSMSSNQSGEGGIRKAIIEADLVDGMVALPGQLFYSTQIPVCLWIGGKNNTLDLANDTRLFDGETELSLVV